MEPEFAKGCVIGVPIGLALWAAIIYVGIKVFGG